MTGRKIGSYRLLRQLGAGGMGEVYLAHDDRLDRRVAVKVVQSELLAKDRTRARFQREARLLASVNHPYVVQVFEVLEDKDGRQLLVMEHLEGETLRQCLARGPLPLDRVSTVARELAEGLDAIHQAGLLHRDLKAENVMVTANGHLKILDFGLAKPRQSRLGETSISMEGYVAGTYAAMSPEQIQGQELDPRSDLFSLGILLYELLTGEHPFRGETAQATLVRICRDRQTPACELRHEVPWALSHLVDRLLEKSPEARPRDAQQLRFELDQLDLETSPPTAPGSTDSGDHTTLRSAEALGPVSPPPGKLRGRRYLLVASFIALVVLLLALGLWLTSDRWGRDEPVTLAVLEPANSQGRADLDWYGAAIARALAAQLAAGGELHVLDADWVAETRRQLDLDPGENSDRVLEVLDADLVVTGSYLPVSDEEEAVQLELRLRRSSLPTALWSHAGVTQPGDLWRTLADRSHDIRQALGVATLPPGEALAIQKSLPSQPEVVELFGQGLARLSRLDAAGAVATLEAASQVDPDAARIWGALSEAYRLQGRGTRALEAARRSLALTDPFNEQERLRAEARVREEEGSWDAAVELRQRLFDLQPSDLAAGLKLARALLRDDSTPRALDLLRNLGDLPGAASDPRLYLLRSRALYHVSDFAGQLEQARRAEACARVLDAPGALGEALILQAVARLLQGKVDEARTLRHAAQEHFAVSGDVLSSLRTQEVLAFELNHRGQLAEAEKLYSRVLAGYAELGHGSGYSRVLTNLGAVLVQQGRGGEAKALFQQARLELEGSDAEVARAINAANEVVPAMIAGDLDAAEAVFRRSLEVFTELGRTNYRTYMQTNLGEIHFLRGELDEARELHEQARDLRRLLGESTPYNRLWLARIDAAQGNLGSAEVALRQIAEQGENAAYFDLAQIELWLGRPGRAVEWAERLLKTSTGEEPIDARLLSLAWDLIAHARLADGNPEAATAARTRAGEAALGRDDLELELRLRITSALLQTRRGPAEAAEALADLERLVRRAERADFHLMKYEARLAAAQISLDRDSDRETLERLRRELEDRGLGGLAVWTQRLLASD